MTRNAVMAAAAAVLLAAFGCGTSIGEAAGPDGNGNGIHQDPQPAAAFVPVSLALRADAPFRVGTTVKLRAVGTDAKGEEKTLTSGVTFSSSDEGLATVNGKGLAEFLAPGPVSFTATLGELSAKIEERSRCEYPRFSAEIALDRTMPPLSWPAKRPDGTSFDLNLEDVRCSPEWADTQTIMMVLSAGWCGPCTNFSKWLAGVAKNPDGSGGALPAGTPAPFQQFDELGMKIVIVELQNLQGNPAGVDFAYSHIKSDTKGNVPSIAVGGGDTVPGDFFDRSTYLEFFPTIFVVRTRDMRIIADGKISGQNQSMPFARIAKDPEADWTMLGQPAFKNRCGPGDEQTASNHTAKDALAIDPGTHKGGICRDAPSFYKVGVEGKWKLELDYKADFGALDVFIWDDANGGLLEVDAQVFGSSSSTGHESFEYEGPATVIIKPYRRASSPYVLKLTEL
ncbi:hypothetical protein [Vulgatibacter incomptus]|uniref:BIG2 domain-containing protein n=1 Tax=Vulgatibacter incomptus TaxID=1391653 RepID=A0A0K1PDQ6_9BACT|nr:hypothetical protein [Vulgatibacter incomptus]AKU91546.1 hypothetical protein AKJ08_1933 [Vulgatibacter incomptus]